MTPDDLKIQRQLVDDGVIALWRWIHGLGTENMTTADVELWSQLTLHPAIRRMLGSRVQGLSRDGAVEPELFHGGDTQGFDFKRE